MFDRLKKVIDKIKDLNYCVNTYKQESVIQSLPSVAYVNQAKKFLDEKDFEKAEELLKKAIEISPKEAAAYKYLGVICTEKKDFPNAESYFKSSASINPQDKEIWVKLGFTRLELGDLEGAWSAFEYADKLTPVNTDVKTGLGMVLMKQKKYALARDKFMQAVKIQKYNYCALLFSGILDTRLGDYDLAEEKLAFLVKTAPNECSTYEYANLKLLKNDFEMAELYAKKSIEFNSKMFPAYSLLAKIYSIKKDTQKIDEIFNTALSHQLESAVLYYEWGKAYLDMFGFEKAQEKFEMALKLDENHNPSKFGMALVGAYNSEFTLLEELKERSEDDALIQSALGLECFAQGEFEQAIEYFKKALKNDCKLTFNNLFIARCYKNLNDKDRAKDYYEKFLTEFDDYTPGFVEYSKWLMDIKDYSGAQRKLRKAQKISPENTEVLNLLFFVSYILVKENICEYNVKEAISLAAKTEALGDFHYGSEKTELEKMLRK